MDVVLAGLWGEGRRRPLRPGRAEGPLRVGRCVRRRPMSSAAACVSAVAAMASSRDHAAATPSPWPHESLHAIDAMPSS